MVTPAHAAHRQGQRLPAKKRCHEILSASVLLAESKPKPGFEELWNQLNQKRHKTLQKEKYFTFYTLGFFLPTLFPLPHPCWISTAPSFSGVALEGKKQQNWPSQMVQEGSQPRSPEAERGGAASPRVVPSPWACEGGTKGLGGPSCLLLQHKKSLQSQNSFPPANCSPGSPQAHFPKQGRGVSPCCTQLLSQHRFKASDADPGKPLLFPVNNSSLLTPNDC